MRKLNDVLKKTGIEIYREITAVALYSMISSLVLVAIVMYVKLMVALVLLPVLYMPLFYGVCYAYHRKTERGKSRLKDVFQGAVKGLGPAIVMGIFFVVMILILWSTWWYYGGKEGMGSLAFGVFQTYFVIMALVSQFYTFQLVIQEGMGIFKAMAHSVKLFLKFPAYTLGACFQALVVAVPLLLTVVGFGFLFNGMWAIFQHKATYNVLNPEEPKSETGSVISSEAGSVGI